MGNQPFYERTEYLVYQRISKGEYKVPTNLVDETLTDLIKKLLIIEPIERIGSGLDDTDGNGLKKLKGHEFFRNIDWNNVSKVT